MAQSVQQSVDKEAISSLKVNNKGWNIQLFEDQIKISACLCTKCKSVCSDAVELGCDHDDDDIFLFCNSCLNNLVNENNNKCPIDGHDNPIIIATRASRRQISKAIVFCPYSAAYKSVNDELINNNNNNNNGEIIDTFGGDEKEGIQQQQIQNKNKMQLNKGVCSWKGPLNDLINNHISQCVQDNNPSFALNIKIKELQYKNNALKQENISFKNEVNTEKRKNEQLNQQLNDFKNQINIKNEMISSKQNEIDQQQQFIEQLQNKIESMEQENDDLKNQLNEQCKLMEDIMNNMHNKDEKEEKKQNNDIDNDIDNNRNEQFTFSVESEEQSYFKDIKPTSITYKGSVFGAMRGSRCFFGPWLNNKESFTVYFGIPKIGQSSRSSCYGFGFVTSGSKRYTTSSTHSMFMSGIGEIYIYDEFLGLNVNYKHQERIQYMNNLIVTPSNGIIISDNIVAISVDMKNRKTSIWNDDKKQKKN